MPTSRWFCALSFLLAFPAIPSLAGQESAWLAEVQDRIAAEEYHVTWQDHTVLPGLERAWHAPNRSHDLRTYFTENGIRVVRRTESEPSWELKLSLTGYGRGETVSPVGEARLLPNANRVDYQRGDLVEWYLNDRHGLEQGFTLHAPPDGSEPRSEPAFLVLSLGGSLSPVISADGQAIDFATPGGANVLHYAHLKVTDAGGRELPARLEGFAAAGARGIRIVFDDAEAAYPVTVDPLLTSPAWTVEGDQEYELLGGAVSTAGDVNGDGYADVIVGARWYDNGEYEEGRALVYHGSAAGLSITPAWSAEGDQEFAHFGSAVATAGDVNGDGYADVIVGTSDYDDVFTDTGQAFVYHGSAAGLSATPAWTNDSNQSYARFGYSVSTAGDVNGDGYADVIVGALTYDNGESDEGGAFVYHGSPTGLSSTPDWVTEGGQDYAQHGTSVSTAGDVNGDGYADVIVGAPQYSNGQLNEGRTYVYHGSPSGLSTLPAWIAESDQQYAQFGVSVMTAGDVNGDGYADVIVGARTYDNGAGAEGRAFGYLGSSAGLSPTAEWAVSSGQTGVHFGRSVSTAGDVNGDGYADVIVGAYLYNNGEFGEGRAFVYHGSAGGLSFIAGWTGESNQVNANYGMSVSTAGDVNGDGYADVIVGAPFYDDVGAEEGRAYVYHGSPAGLRSVAGWTGESNQVDADFGMSVSTAGDVNGDGYADVIVGAPRYDNGESDEGRAFLYHGAAQGLSTTPAWFDEGDQANAHYGTSVASAGDVNGDGYADVIVGADEYDNGEVDEGRAFLYYGAPAGLSAMPNWTAEGNQASAYLGWSVATAGDVDGDGYADVIVGAPGYDSSEVGGGCAFVYRGSATGLGPAAAWTGEANQASAAFGASVSTAGDVNGDGYADVIVGASSYSNGQSSEGRAFAYHGSAAGLTTAPVWTVEGNQIAAHLGISVSTAGDVNGDGYADVIVGAYTYDNGETDEGRAFVYHGSSGGLSFSPAWTVESNQADTYLGNSVSGAGDVNGDGYSDVIVGAYGYTNGQVAEGRALVYHGSAAGLSSSPDWAVESDQALALFGGFVSTAGDVNGDGCADVIVGAYDYSNGEGSEGGAFLYYGNDGLGLALKPQQRRSDDLAPIAAGGRSRVSDRFRLGALGRTPFGRGLVQLEWEAKPLGQPFDGSGTGMSGWTDTGTAGATFNELLSGLEPGAWHWRMRLHYDRVTTPLQAKSRWFTVPWNGWQERDLTLSPYIGGRVWEDRDGNGLMDEDEPRLGGVLVLLIDGYGNPVQGAVTASDGSYRFDTGSGGVLAVRFQLPTDWYFTVRDQGTDDTIDSDADTITGETAPILPPFGSADATRWSAGMRRLGACIAPDEPVYIYGMRLSTDGNDYPILDFQDPNQPADVSGYNVYRSAEAGLPPASWPMVASDVVDMDEAEPNKQWVDTSGDDPGGDIWYYQVAPYNHICDAEGPW